MELEITEQNDNPLLNRQEIKVVIKHNESSTPRRNQVIKNISEQLKWTHLLRTTWARRHQGSAESKVD